MTFQDLQTQVFTLYSEKKYTEILKVLEEKGAQFPDHAWAMSFWWLCLYALTGRTDDAIRTLREGLDRGWWQSPTALRGDPDLQSLQGNPEYEALVERSAALRAEAQKHVKPHQVIHEPQGGSSKNTPLIIALHGNNSNAESVEPFWKPMVERGYLLASMQSTQVSTHDKAFVWDDYEIATYDVKQYYARLARDYTFDPERIIFGGFSMGGQTAVRLALEWTFGARGFISVGGWMGDDPQLSYLQTALQAEHAKKIRGVIIIGDHDQGSYKGALRLAELLSAAGISHQLSVIPGLAHTYPENYIESLAAAARFVLEG
jgi:predicted esterase